MVVESLDLYFAHMLAVAPYLHLASALAGIVIAFLSYFRSDRHRAVVRFAMLNLAVAGWNFGEFAAGMCENPKIAALWIKFSLASTAFIFSLCLHFILRYMRKETPTSRTILKCSYALTVLLIVALFHPTLVIQGVAGKPWRAITGPLYLLHMGAYASVLVYAFLLLGLFMKRAENRIERNLTAHLVFWGTLAGLFGLTHFLDAIGLPVPLLGHVGTFLFSVSVFYTIYRYRIMDIRMAFRKGILLTATLSILTGMYLILVLSSESVLLYFTGEKNRLVTYLSVMVFAVLFQPFQRRIHRLGARWLFPIRHHYQRSLSEFGTRLAQYSGTEQLSADLVRKLDETAVFRHSAVYLWNEDFSHLDRIHQSDDLSSRLPRWTNLAETDKKDILDLQALEHRLRVEVLSATKQAEIHRQIEFLHSLQAWLSVPIEAENRFWGLLLLGPKSVYAIVDQEDLQILKALATQTARALLIIQSEERARKAERLAEIGQLSATIAHEIKNPLSAIRGSAQLLRDGKGGETQTEIILEESERLNRILMEYLDFSRPSKLEFEKVEWFGYLQKVLPRLDQTRVKLETQLKEEPGQVLLDPDRILQVIVNLHANAVRAAGEAGKVAIESHIDSLQVILIVRDTGPGFGQEALRKAMEPFFTTHEDGTGLGLAITKKIVEEHKGSIRISNAESGGGMVEIHLPVAKPE